MNYISLLQKHGLKATPQRVQILSIMQNAGHININDLFGKIVQIFPSISLATLYKNLHIMLNSNLISELKIPNMKPRYELSKDPHAHLLCQECGSFIDFSFDINTLTEDISQKSGYKLRDSTLIFNGICPKCQINKNYNNFVLSLKDIQY